MPAADRAAQSAAVTAALAASPVWRTAARVFVYRTLGTEVDTGPLLELAWGQGKHVAVPRVAGRHLETVPVTPGTRYVRGAFRTEEPAEGTADLDPYDLAVVPGLLFDRQGHRLGYGRGFYDAFLARGRQATSVGLCYDWAWTQRLPAEPHDMRVDWVATPNGVHPTQR